MNFSKFFLTAILSTLLLGACTDKPAPNTATPAPVVAAYDVTMAEGINFLKDGYPRFITEVVGMSGLEPWGRWSDANSGGPVVRFTFKDKLPSSFKLLIAARAFGPNEGKPIIVKAGNSEKSFVINKNETDSIYAIEFKNVDSNLIEFTPPVPTSPKSIGLSEDIRKLGIGFVGLKIQE